MQVDDGNGGLDSQTISVTVTDANDAPVVTDDAVRIKEDTAVTGSVLANDSDVDGDSLTVASVTQGTNGAVTTNGTKVTYTPNGNFHGTDSFTYTVSDGNGGEAGGTVHSTVTPMNDAPVAVQDTLIGNDSPMPEGIDGVVRQVDPEFLETTAPDRVGLEDLESFCPVGDAGGEREDAEPGFGIHLGLLVGIDEIARLLVQGERGAVRQDVSQAIQQRDPGGDRAQVLQGRGSHPAELVAPGPPVAEGEVEIVVDLLEHEAVAGGVLVEFPLDGGTFGGRLA